MISGVYLIVNLQNGYRYVGSSFNMSRRWHEHRKRLRLGKHDNPFLQAAWRKYGESSFSFRLVERTDDLLAREAFHIQRLKPEYNIRAVVNGVFRTSHSDETRAQIRRSHLGIRPSHETRARMSESAKARGISDHVRIRQREALTGRPRSAEACRAISEGKLGKQPSPEHRAAVSAGMSRWWANQPPKTVCRKRRHPWTAENILVCANGVQTCLACRSEWMERQRAARKTGGHVR